jgi:hypothetical protein
VAQRYCSRGDLNYHLILRSAMEKSSNDIKSSPTPGCTARLGFERRFGSRFHLGQGPTTAQTWAEGLTMGPRTTREYGMLALG